VEGVDISHHARALPLLIVMEAGDEVVVLPDPVVVVANSGEKEDHEGLAGGVPLCPGEASHVGLEILNSGEDR
jgi:hypothetical protein